MGAGAYAAGAGFFSVTVGCSVLTAALLVQRLPHLSGAPRFLAASLLSTFALISAHLLPGVLGVLARETVLVSAIAGSAAAWAFVRGARRADSPASPGPREDARDPLPRALAVIAAAAITVCVVGYFRTEARQVVIANDMLNYHLPLLASWIRSGSMWPVVDLLPYDATGNYPQNGNVVELAAVLPWRADTFARLMMIPYIGLTGIATYALGREFRVPVGRAALLGCAVVATPILLSAAVAGLPDAVMYSTFGAGLVFLVRCARSLSLADALLAGLGLGLAFGTKWYAVPTVAATVLLFGGLLLIERRGLRTTLRLVCPLAGVIALSGGFWLVRNAVESGSPFFPGGWLPVGARWDFDNPAPRSDFPLSHYLFDGEIWRQVILPDELKAFGIGGILLAAGLLVAGILSVRAIRRGERAARPVLWTAVVTVVLALVYVVTPNTALGFEGQPALVYYNARYLVPAVIPAAAVLGWAGTRVGRGGAVVDVLAVAAVADGLRRAFDLAPGEVIVGLFSVVLAGVAAWGLWWLGRPSGAVRRRRFVLAAAGAAAVALAGGYAIEMRYSRDRLIGRDAAIDYFLRATRDGDRVGVTGQWSVAPPSPVHPMFGERFRNHVDYVGRWHEGANKPYRTRAAFSADVERGRYDWLIVGRGAPPRRDAPAMAWAASSGYRLVAQTPRLALYRAR